MSDTKTKKCSTCGNDIPQGRLEAIPTTTTCVKCSTVEPYVGFNVFPHKTGSYIIKVNPKNKEALRRARRADKRER